MTHSESMLNSKTDKWFDRLANFFYQAQMTRLVGELRVEAPTVFRSMVHDVDSHIAPEVETEIARHLSSPYQDDLKPSEILMPKMMAKYGITEAEFMSLERKHRQQLARRCNQCTKVSQCWLAMRAKAELEECERFCPNQASFDAISH